MKYYEYNSELDKIEFFNSFTGIETVHINGKMVSKRFSITGTEHKFMIDSSEYKIITRYGLFKSYKYNLQLLKNKKIIDLKHIELNKKYRLIVVVIAILLIIWLFNLINTL